jgi:hypothetical protein
LGGRMSRKTQVARRFSQFRKTFQIDAQAVQKHAVKRLKEIAHPKARTKKYESLLKKW